MAKISVSLPDELKAQLSAYAQDHGQGVSDVIQAALKAYFKPAQPHQPPPQPPAPLPPPQPPVQDQQMAAKVKQLEDHVSLLTYQAEHMRQGLGQVTCAFKRNWGLLIPCPQAITEPPWPHTTPPGWGPNYPAKYLP